MEHLFLDNLVSSSYLLSNKMLSKKKKKCCITQVTRSITQSHNLNEIEGPGCISGWLVLSDPNNVFMHVKTLPNSTIFHTK